MTRRLIATAVCALVFAGGDARADNNAPPVDLELPWSLHGVVRSLHMRPIVWTTAVQATPPKPATKAKAKPKVDRSELPVAVSLAATPPDSTAKLAEIKAKEPSLSDKVIFRMNLGFGLDNARPSGDPLRSGATLDRTSNYAQLREYGFGDAVIGTRGLGAQSLSSYFASQFRFDKKTRRPSGPVPTIYDIEGVRDVLVRSGYAEVEGIFDNPLLKPLFFRAGRQYRYGPAVAHFDGISLGWDTPTTVISVFTGRRVSLYNFDTSEYIENGGVIAGGRVRIDMYKLRKVPLVLEGTTLAFDDTVHFVGGLTLRWSKDVLMDGSIRILGNAFVRQRLQLRARISKVSTVNLELENRSGDDWTYDLLVENPEYDATDPRHWLSLGKPLPRLYLNLRAGTVWLQNFDLLLRAGAAIDTRDTQFEQSSSFSASYFELGGAVEARIRRAVAVGASLLVRRFNREKDMVAPEDGPDELPDYSGAFGERSFAEGGITLRLSRAAAGAFTASAELYGRIYRHQSPFPTDLVDDPDRRFGGRFSVVGYVDKRLRLRAEYDNARAPQLQAPELRDIQSLRLMLEGTF